jgi:hypothetical protein
VWRKVVEAQPAVHRRRRRLALAPVACVSYRSAVACAAPEPQEVGVPDRLTGAVGEQQRPTAHRLDPLGQQIGEEHRKIDHAPATVLRRPEEPTRVHILMHRAELRIDLIDSPAHAEPGRLQAKSPGAHRAHLAPPHSGGHRDDHHQRLLRRQPLPHRQNRTKVYGDTHTNRPPLAGGP